MLRNFAMPMTRPFIPVMLPLSIMDMLFDERTLTVSGSVAVPKILGLSTKTPVMYAASVTPVVCQIAPPNQALLLLERIPSQGWLVASRLLTTTSQLHYHATKRYCSSLGQLCRQALS